VFQHDRRVWVRLLTARGLPPSRVAFVIDVEETIVLADLACRHPVRRTTLTPPIHGLYRRPKDRPILGQLGTRVRRLASLGYAAEWIAETLVLKPSTVNDFLSRLEPVRKAELARPRDRAEEGRLRAKQAAVAAREERRRLITPPTGWTNGDRFTTGEAADWARFMTALQEARVSGAEILGLASRVWFAPPRSRPERPPAEPAIWTGPESPHVGNPKLTPDMVAEMKVLRAQGWSTGKLAKRYGVTRATICYALLGRTRHYAPANTAAALPERIPKPELTRPRQPIGDGERAEGPGWSPGDRFMTGEASEWARFRAAMDEARQSGVSSEIFAASRRMRHDALPVEPAIWAGPDYEEPDDG
jgi:hypothetical protein